jgi:hypothetical protein
MELLPFCMKTASKKWVEYTRYKIFHLYVFFK